MSGSGGNAVMAAQSDEPGRPETSLAQVVAPGVEGLVQPVRPGPLRLPLMERLVDRWPAAACERLTKAWGITVELARGPMRTALAADFLETLDETVIVAQFDAANGSHSGMLALERAGVFMMIDAVLGGAGKAPSEAAMRRALTLIELSLMQPVASHLMAALSSCLEPAGKIAFRFRSWGERGAAPAAGGGVLLLPLTLGWHGRQAQITAALSLAALEPMLPALGGVYPGAALGGDGAWRGHLAREIGRARTRLTAVLAEAEMPLARVRSLAVGETLAFDVPSDPVVSLHAGTMLLANGRLGRANGRVAVRLETAVAAGTGDRR